MSLDDVPRELLAALLAVALASTIVLLARGRIRRARARRRQARAVVGEREAARLLEAHGFTIEGFQVEGGYVIEVDDAAVQVGVRADYVVSRSGERFVAEVKTGQLAPRIETAATRRQLLEYEHAFDVAGVLLVDAEAGSVRRVVFTRPRSEARWGLWALAVVILAVIAAALRA